MRKSKPKKRYLLPDPKFNDTLVTKFVNYMMEQGKKSVAYNIFYDAIAIVEKKAAGESGLEVWKRALTNVTPGVEVKSRRVYDWRVRTNCTSSSSAYSQAQFSTTTPPPTGCAGIYDVSTNGTTGGAELIPLNTDVNGTISPANDNDYYRFQITTGGTITVTLQTLPDNYQLDLLNSGGSRIGRSTNNGTVSESISATVASGDYYARAYPKGNASNASLCYTLKVITGTSAFEEQELIVDSRINVFPNPAGKTVTINIPGINGRADIVVFDMNGRMVVQKNSNQAATRLDVSALAPGIYLIKVKMDGKESNIKMIKE